MRFLRRPGPALAALLFLLVGAAFVTQVVPYQQILDSNKQVDEARGRLSSLLAENEQLGADVEALNTPEEIEKLAREKLGYVRPGETSYVVLAPPDSAREQAPEETEPVDEPKTWVDQVWDFISGGDIASGG